MQGDFKSSLSLLEKTVRHAKEKKGWHPTAIFDSSCGNKELCYHVKGKKWGKEKKGRVGRNGNHRSSLRKGKGKQNHVKGWRKRRQQSPKRLREKPFRRDAQGGCCLMTESVAWKKYRKGQSEEENNQPLLRITSPRGAAKKGCVGERKRKGGAEERYRWRQANSRDGWGGEC